MVFYADEEKTFEEPPSGAGWALRTWGSPPPKWKTRACCGLHGWKQDELCASALMDNMTPLSWFVSVAEHFVIPSFTKEQWKTMRSQVCCDKVCPSGRQGAGIDSNMRRMWDCFTLILFGPDPPTFQFKVPQTLLQKKGGLPPDQTAPWFNLFAVWKKVFGSFGISDDWQEIDRQC